MGYSPKTIIDTDWSYKLIHFNHCNFFWLILLLRKYIFSIFLALKRNVIWGDNPYYIRMFSYNCANMYKKEYITELEAEFPKDSLGILYPTGSQKMGMSQKSKVKKLSVPKSCICIKGKRIKIISNLFFDTLLQNWV